MAHILYRNGAGRSGGSLDEMQHPFEGAEPRSDEQAQHGAPSRAFDMGYVGARPPVGGSRSATGVAGGHPEAYGEDHDGFAQQAARRGAEGRLHYAPSQHPAVHQSLMEAVRDENPAVRHFIDLQRAAEARAAEIAAAEAARRLAFEQAQEQARREAELLAMQAEDARGYGALGLHDSPAGNDDWAGYAYQGRAQDESAAGFGGADEYGADYGTSFGANYGDNPYDMGFNDPRILAAASAAQHSAQARGLGRDAGGPHGADPSAQAVEPRRVAPRRVSRLPQEPESFREALGAYMPAGGVRWMMRRTAALGSVAMVIGLGIWGYQLAQRDIAGVLVIAAPEGPSREAPLDPGGELARHTGLSVNAIAAIGTAAPGPDRVVLAPRPMELLEEDAPMSALKPLPLRAAAAETEAAPQETERLFEAALPVANLGTKDADSGFDPTALTQVVPKLAEGDDLSPPDVEDPELAASADAPDTTAETASADIQPTLPTSVPGLKVSPRPIARPQSDLQAEAAAAAVAEAFAPETPEAIDIAAEDLPSGTRLVQIGAHDSADQARAEWARVTERFGALMAGKRRVIQEAVSGGRTFYRLRVEGFVDVADSRRFCAALVAERTNCIPAQVR
ncbi:SPOR domain-containing protein [Albirhodobacter sp. R86504]|uniref:SPOR domain-containing protein n=1 Tax=Albirhodobacter sp. R86504 TaxID=3093848 RepID=UPI00366CA2FD